jgi:hypothetical protein
MNNNNFYINQGMFTSCKKYYDKDTDKMKNATVSEVFNCCLDKCKPTVDFCKKFCNIKTKEHVSPISVCINKCNIHHKFCLDNCELSSKYTLPMQNLYQKCLNKLCDNDDDYTKCIKNNKYQLRKCCMKDCTPSRNLNCNKYCNFFQDFFNQKQNISLAKTIRIKRNTNTHIKFLRFLPLLIPISLIILITYFILH